MTDDATSSSFTSSALLRDALIKSDDRVKELEKVLIDIRDRLIPNIERHASEGDKVICGAGAILSKLAPIIPIFKFPVTPPRGGS